MRIPNSPKATSRYRLENIFGDKAAQPGIIMQFDVKLSRSTSAVCSTAQQLPFRDD